MGAWCNGSTPRSHRGNEGSIPSVSIEACEKAWLAAHAEFWPDTIGQAR